MKSFVVRANDPIQVRHQLGFKDGIETVSVDFSPWAEDNGTVSAVTWTLESGSAGISGENLASNVATAQITTSDTGGSMIKLKATGTNDTKVIYFRVYAKDPHQYSDDYGLCL